MLIVQVVGFVPTGWMYEMKRKAFPVRDKGPCFIHLVPYSEHSSYSELREYVRFLRPHKVVPSYCLSSIPLNYQTVLLYSRRAAILLVASPTTTVLAGLRMVITVL